MEKSKIHGKTTSTSSYAQVVNLSVNILRIKEAFPTFPNKKILKIHNAAFSKLGHKSKKIQSTTKGPSQKQVIVPVFTNLTNTIIEEANDYDFQIMSRTMRSRSRVTQNGVELLWSERELTTKVGNNLGLSSCAVSQSDVACIVAYFRRTELLPEV